MGFKSPGTADYGGHILNLSFFMVDIHTIFRRRAVVGLLKKVQCWSTTWILHMLLLCIKHRKHRNSG